MATVNFLYRSTKENAPLNLRLLFRILDLPSEVVNKKTKEIIKLPYTDVVLGAKTNFEVSKHYWTKEHRQKRGEDPEITNRRLEVNTELNRIENHILGAFNKSNPKEVTKDWLTLQMELYYNPPQQEAELPIKLIDYIDFYIDFRKHELKESSIKKFNVVKHKLQRLQHERGKPLLIKDINENFKNEFVDYQKAKGYAQNTMQRELKFIKTFCRHAQYMGLEIHPQLNGLKLEKAKAEKIYLTFDELEAIEKTELNHGYLENARDWLIISCYTGQRISDFMRFEKEMIRVEEGKSFLEFTQKKTDKIMTVPLHKKVLEILKKRNGEFPRSISDQRYNEYIKEVCKEAKINDKVQGGVQQKTKNGMRKVSGKYYKWELVTSHIGRRSFATNFYGTIRTTYLIYITGHGSEAMFLEYIGKSNKDLAMEIANFF